MEENFVLVRTYSAGVHCGLFVSGNGKEAKLKNARRIWRWRGANSLNELANKGCDEDWTRISEPADYITLTEVIEIITCKKEGRENLERSRWEK